MAGDVELTEGTLKGGDLDQAVAVAVRAFGDDALFSWYFPAARRRSRALAALHRTVLRHAAATGVTRAARIDGRIVGVAVWIPPGGWPYPVSVQLRQNLDAMWSFSRAPRSLPRAARMMQSVERAHPKRREWYLQLLMVDPPEQRRGIGGRLQTDTLAECDKERLPAWLETQKEENLAYYGRFGFEVIREHHPAEDGPTMWSLNRDPQPA